MDVIRSYIEIDGFTLIQVGLASRYVQPINIALRWYVAAELKFSIKLIRYGG